MEQETKQTAELIVYKCPNCSRETTKEEQQPLVLCGCGYEMEIKGVVKVPKCIMCKKPARYTAEAKYKAGTIQEPLCESCMAINEQIKRSRQF